MTKKHLYFVRHGEITENIERRDSTPESPLTEKGKQQSQFLAERFASIPFDAILASPYLRTQQTAEIFNTKHQKPVAYSELLQEVRGPSELAGIQESDERHRAVRAEITAHAHDPKWHYSDEENFSELHERAQKALAFLLERPEETLVVITHGGILKLMVNIMIHGEEPAPEAFHRLVRLLKTQNTGITYITHGSTNATGDWQIITWMDHAHLGDAPTREETT